MTKRGSLQLLTVQVASIALVACGGGGGASGTAFGTGAGLGGGTNGGFGDISSGSLVIAGTSNIPDPATAFVPDAGLGASSSLATTSANLLSVAVNSLVNGKSRSFSASLAGTSTPSINSVYTVVADAGQAGSVLSLTVVELATTKSYFFSSESGTVKITAISATSVDLLFTNVTLSAALGAQNNAANGKVVLNGTITIKRV